MEFLLDPNVAYLFLVGGVLLMLLAVASPGTGLLEVSGFFCLALAGYAAYHLRVNWWALGVMALALLPFVYALQKPKREIYLGLAILGWVCGSIFLFADQAGRPAVNPVLALIASTLFSGFTWMAIRKSIQAAHLRPAHDLERLVGQIGEAKTPVHQQGSVQVAGELWSARSEEPIVAKTPVRVLRREGLVLLVEKVSQSKHREEGEK